MLLQRTLLVTVFDKLAKKPKHFKDSLRAGKIREYHFRDSRKYHNDVTVNAFSKN